MTGVRIAGESAEPLAGSVVPVREAHRFDEAALARYLRGHAEGFAGPLRIRQFHGGQSNPTFLLESGERRFVLRKKPPGTLLPSAHQIEREFRVQRALQGTAVPVPEQVLLCEDAGVIGTAFYVMAFVDGRIPQRIEDLGGAAQAARMSAALVETLAALHAVDWRAAGLSDFGRGEGYLARQLDRWSRQYRASVCGMPHPFAAPLAEWLSGHLPRTSATAVTHGDYRFGNMVFDDHHRVAAVLDWELSTLGDPLADLAYLCVPYHLPPGELGVMGLQGLDLAPMGIPDPSAVVAAYCRHTGRGHVPDWRFYRAFSFFRLAAIVQGVYARAKQGNASSSTAHQFERSASRYLRIAWDIAQGSEDED